jgi:Tol biopolymer transport system component
VGLGGKSADWYSNEPSISADGRRVAFTSRATNLVNAKKHRVTDIYVRDLNTHKTTLVSANSSGDGPSRRSLVPSISADGRFVAFTSLAPNLVAGDTNGLDDVFLRDLTSGTTQRVSVGSAGNQSVTDHSEYGVVSGHGEFVAFESGATDLVVPDANGPRLDIYLRDVANHTTRRVSVNSAGVQGNDTSSVPSISADGRYVGFWSFATNLASPDDTNGSGEPFIRGPLQP